MCYSLYLLKSTFKSLKTKGFIVLKIIFSKSEIYQLKHQNPYIKKLGKNNIEFKRRVYSWMEYLKNDYEGWLLDILYMRQNQYSSLDFLKEKVNISD